LQSTVVAMIGKFVLGDLIMVK